MQIPLTIINNAKFQGKRVEKINPLSYPKVRSATEKSSPPEPPEEKPNYTIDEDDNGDTIVISTTEKQQQKEVLTYCVYTSQGKLISKMI